VEPKIYNSQEHTINKEDVDTDALCVIHRLAEAGFTAYLVGGGVRDLLVGKTPKDYDISTSARPDQVRKLFRNCFLIGRRFRLAHIRFGNKIIEVSTFRSGNLSSDNIILRDNTWGSEEEDVLRRDFTINGLFYDPERNVVIDYVDGYKDLKKHLLRVIGDPVTRFRQDPVRMLRMIKFQARFDFEIDPGTREALHTCRYDIFKSSQARILEETLKMLESRAAKPFFRLLLDYELLEILYPILHDFLSGDFSEEVYVYLKYIDKVHADAPENLLDRSLLVSSILYPILQRELNTQYFDRNATPSLRSIFYLSSDLLKAFITSSFPQFPRKMKGAIHFILDAQYRMTPISSKKIVSDKFLSHEDFPTALAFLHIRATMDNELMPIYSSWEEKYNTYKASAPRRRSSSNRSSYQNRRPSQKRS
jgi:poly(A) polymerase